TRCASLALPLAPDTAARIIDAKMPITAITTRSSISVNPLKEAKLVVGRFFSWFMFINEYRKTLRLVVEKKNALRRAAAASRTSFTKAKTIIEHHIYNCTK